MIRRATSKDIAPILEMGKALIQSIGDLPEMDEQSSRMMLARALCDRKQILLVSERGGEVKGFFWGHIEEFIFSKEKLAQDIVFHAVDASMPFMIARFKAWAKQMGIKPKYIAIGVSNAANPEHVDQLMGKLNFQRTGGYYRYRGE